MDALETDRVSVTDTYGDGRHVSIDVVSPVFDGMSSVKRQQKVYKVCTVAGRGACYTAAQQDTWPQSAYSCVAIRRGNEV
jgi:BolA-like protein